MLCGSCGDKIDAGSRFCPSCGAELPSLPENKQLSRSFLAFILVALVVLFVLGAWFGLHAVSQVLWEKSAVGYYMFWIFFWGGCASFVISTPLGAIQAAKLWGFKMYQDTVAGTWNTSAKLRLPSWFVVPAFGIGLAGSLLAVFLLSAWGISFLLHGERTPPKDDRLAKEYRQKYGPVSVADSYILLIGKADVYENKKLLAYLKALPGLPRRGRGNIHVSGDLKPASIDWTSHENQTAIGIYGDPVDLAPGDVQELDNRKRQLIALGASTALPPPPKPVVPPQRGTGMDNLMYNQELGTAFVCANTPVYEFPLSLHPPGTGLNKAAALTLKPGTEVQIVGTFDAGLIRSEARIKPYKGANDSYFIRSDQLKASCPAQQTTPGPRRVMPKR